MRREECRVDRSRMETDDLVALTRTTAIRDYERQTLEAIYPYMDELDDFFTFRRSTKARLARQIRDKVHKYQRECECQDDVRVRRAPAR